MSIWERIAASVLSGLYHEGCFWWRDKDVHHVIPFCNYNVARELDYVCKWSLPPDTITFISHCWHKFSLNLKICEFFDSSLWSFAYRRKMFTTQSVKVLLSADTFLLMWQVLQKLHSQNIFTHYVLGHVVAGFPHLDWLVVYSEGNCETVFDQANRQKLNEDHVVHFSCIFLSMQTNSFNFNTRAWVWL